MTLAEGMDEARQQLPRLPRDSHQEPRKVPGAEDPTLEDYRESGSTSQQTATTFLDRPSKP